MTAAVPIIRLICDIVTFFFVQIPIRKAMHEYSLSHILAMALADLMAIVWIPEILEFANIAVSYTHLFGYNAFTYFRIVSIMDTETRPPFTDILLQFSFHTSPTLVTEPRLCMTGADNSTNPLSLIHI